MGDGGHWPSLTFALHWCMSRLVVRRSVGVNSPNQLPTYVDYYLGSSASTYLAALSWKGSAPLRLSQASAHEKGLAAFDAMVRILIWDPLDII